ncbi:MAG: GNAT family N-acetyltransferase [Solirubrobacterales bacterium]
MIGKLRRYFGEWGVQGAIARLLRQLREGVVREEVIVLLKKTDSIVVPRRPSELRVEDLEERHLPGLFEVNRKRGAPHADRYFEASIAKGFHGFVALKAGEVVGYYWWADYAADPPHPDLWLLGEGFKMEEGDVYGSSLFLLEQHRGGGAAGDFLCQVETSLRDRGYRRIWGYVERTNRGARWLYSTRGYQPMWKVMHRHFMFFKSRQTVPLDEDGGKV